MMTTIGGYRVLETASGWAVERLAVDGVGRAIAEFLGRDEAHNALAALRRGDASEKDYVWMEEED